MSEQDIVKSRGKGGLKKGINNDILYAHKMKEKQQMINITKKSIETIIRSAITGERLSIPEEVDMDELFECIKKHAIYAIGYIGLVNCGVDKKHPVMVKLMQMYINVMLKSEAQLDEKDKILELFEKNKIDYLLLKGCNIKKMYPKPEMRAMGDADILIREEQYPAIEKIMKGLGYEKTPGANHTYDWKNDKLYVELHRRLIQENHEDYSIFFGNGWEKAKQKEKNIYCYSPEDEFVFVFAHFAKHFRGGGIGYRHLTDLWIYKRFYPDMNWEYVTSELKKLGLAEFFENTMKTVKVCFEDGEKNEKTDFISQFVCSSGNWGSGYSFAVSKSVKAKTIGTVKDGGVKQYTFISAVFPPVIMLAAKYRIVEKHRWLAPIFYVVRWFDVLINRRKSVIRRIKYVAAINDDIVENRKEMFESIGLKYN